MIFQRIEQLCYCIDSGEWPGVRLYPTSQGITDSRSSTPAPCIPGVGPMKLPGTPVGGHDYTIVGNAGEGGSVSVWRSMCRHVDKYMLLFHRNVFQFLTVFVQFKHFSEPKSIALIRLQNY